MWRIRANCEGWQGLPHPIPPQRHFPSRVTRGRLRPQKRVRGLQCSYQPRRNGYGHGRRPAETGTVRRCLAATVTPLQQLCAPQKRVRLRLRRPWIAPWGRSYPAYCLGNAVFPAEIGSDGALCPYIRTYRGFRAETGTVCAGFWTQKWVRARFAGDATCLAAFTAGQPGTAETGTHGATPCLAGIGRSGDRLHVYVASRRRGIRGATLPPRDLLAEMGTQDEQSAIVLDAETGTLCAVSKPGATFAELGTPQKRVRQGLITRFNLVYADSGSLLGISAAETGTRAGPTGALGVPCVPDSAGIRSCRYPLTSARSPAASNARRNGYGSRSISCGKACGIRDLSPQIPVRRFR